MGANLKKYRLESWVDPRIEARTSVIQGTGLFAKEPINEGEVVMIWGGHLLSEEQTKVEAYRKGSVVQISDGLYLGGLPSELATMDDFLNHSCDPNLWLIDEVTLVARRNIKAREELTADYSTWISGSSYWKLEEECNCGSTLCRKRVTGEDWKSKELQKRYAGHFSPYLEKKIKEL